MIFLDVQLLEKQKAAKIILSRNFMAEFLSMKEKAKDLQNILAE